MGHFSRLTRLSFCLLAFAGFHFSSNFLGDVLVLALPAREATAALQHNEEEEEITDNFESGAPLQRLPAIEETRAAILAYSAGVLNCSEGARCLQTPVAAVRDYLRTLTARILIVAKTQLDFNNEDLRKELTKLGCLNVAVVDLQGLQATVGLFKQGVVSRMRIDKETMSPFAEKCDNKLTPLTFHQHEAARSVASRGQLNTDGACDAQNTGGHHDPGYACGPLGNSDCKNHNIPPSSALKGTLMDNGEYRCTPEIYEKRPFACHAGDLSGKVGAGVNVSPDSNRPDYRLLALDTHADNTCVASDSKQALVLHCESTNFRLACAPFERVETAGSRIPELLHELIRVARSALPHSKSQSALLASLVLVNELEQRVAALEAAAKAATRPGDDEETEEDVRRAQ